MNCVYSEGLRRSLAIQQEVQIRPIYECRSDERPKTQVEESTRLVYTVTGFVSRGTGTPKDRDEVNRREDYDICDLYVIGTPSKFKVMSKAEDLARIFPTRDLIREEKATRR